MRLFRLVPGDDPLGLAHQCHSTHRSLLPNTVIASAAKQSIAGSPGLPRRLRRLATTARNFF
jgi:hypothetical protein